MGGSLKIQSQVEPNPVLKSEVEVVVAVGTGQAQNGMVTVIGIAIVVTAVMVVMTEPGIEIAPRMTALDPVTVVMMIVIVAVMTPVAEVVMMTGVIVTEILDGAVVEKGNIVAGAETAIDGNVMVQRIKEATIVLYLQSGNQRCQS
jgi:hypothetical protein